MPPSKQDQTLRRYGVAVLIFIGLASGVFVGLLLVPTSVKGLESRPCCTCAAGRRLGEDKSVLCGLVGSVSDLIKRSDLSSTVPDLGCAKDAATSPDFVVPPVDPQSASAIAQQAGFGSGGVVRSAWNTALHPLWMIGSSFYVCAHCAREHRLGALTAAAWVIGLMLSLAWAMLGALRAPPRADCCPCSLSALWALPATQDELQFWGGAFLAFLVPLASVIHHLVTAPEYGAAAARRSLAAKQAVRQAADVEGGWAAVPDAEPLNLDAIFAELDADGSGTIAFDELMNALSSRRPSAELAAVRNQAVLLFAQLDRNGDGQISIAEIEAGLRSFSTQQLRESIVEYDSDPDAPPSARREGHSIENSGEYGSGAVGSQHTPRGSLDEVDGRGEGVQAEQPHDAYDDAAAQPYWQRSEREQSRWADEEPPAGADYGRYAPEQVANYGRHAPEQVANYGRHAPEQDEWWDAHPRESERSMAPARVPPPARERRPRCESRAMDDQRPTQHAPMSQPESCGGDGVDEHRMQYETYYPSASAAGAREVRSVEHSRPARPPAPMAASAEAMGGARRQPLPPRGASPGRPAPSPRPAPVQSPVQSRPAPVQSPRVSPSPRAASPRRTAPLQSPRAASPGRTSQPLPKRPTSPHTAAGASLARRPPPGSASRLFVFRNQRRSVPMPEEVHFYVRTRATPRRFPFGPEVHEPSVLHVAKLDLYDANSSEPCAVVVITPSTLVGMEGSNALYPPPSLYLCVPSGWSEQQQRVINPQIEPVEMLINLLEVRSTGASNEPARVVVPVKPLRPGQHPEDSATGTRPQSWQH